MGPANAKAVRVGCSCAQTQKARLRKSVLRAVYLSALHGGPAFVLLLRSGSSSFLKGMWPGCNQEGSEVVCPDHAICLNGLHIAWHAPLIAAPALYGSVATDTSNMLLVCLKVEGDLFEVPPNIWSTAD